MTKRRLPFLPCLLVLLLAGSLDAEISLPGIFSDHAVLQRNRSLPVWGTARPDAEITVTLGDRGATGRADADGKWRVELPAMVAGGPYALTIEGDGRVRLEDVMIGEVWLCSGQSNMQWPLRMAEGSEAAAAGADFPEIRLFTVPNVMATEPRENVAADWRVCRPDAVPTFSAVAFFFGRQLHRELELPIGLISSSWGGTRIEPWTDRASLAALPGMEVQFAALEEAIVAQERDRSQIEVAKAAHAKAARQMLQLEADGDASGADPQLDVGAWPTMALPTQWEQAGLPDLDGLVWFRRKVEIPPDWEGKKLVLHLGPVDDTDVTFFDGARVGGMGSYRDKIIEYWDDPRVYSIPGEQVRPGTSIVAVRVIDTGAVGGLWGSEPEEMRLALADDPQQSLPLAGEWRYHVQVELPSVPPDPLQPYTLPTLLYNSMIHPLIPYALRGAIWYQGESNVLTKDGMEYAAKMRAMVEGWRRLWGQGAFPVYSVQLAPFRYSIPVFNCDPFDLPRLWEAQIASLAIPNTGIAGTMDVGNLQDIHPQRKEVVGKRLARWALARDYGRGDLVFSGPLYRSMQVEGKRVRIRFDHAESGLATLDSAPPDWFEVAGSDGNYVAAEAHIDGSTVVAWSEDVPAPKAIRFAWHEEAQPNLINTAGLPALPFRSQSGEEENQP
jgi:sialate O-acetylesterase